MGEMPEQDWERLATNLVNASTPEALVQYYNQLATEPKIDFPRLQSTVLEVFDPNNRTSLRLPLISISGTSGA